MNDKPISRRKLLASIGTLGVGLAGVSLLGGGGTSTVHGASDDESELLVTHPKLNERGVNARDFGAVGNYVPYSQTGEDDTAALQAAVNEGYAARVPVYIPPGKYKITKTIKVPGRVTIYGAGHDTVIYPATSDIDAFHIGGDEKYGPAQADYIGHLRIIGPRSNPTAADKSQLGTGVVINGIPKYVMRNISVSKMGVGFDLINNCYGAAFEHCCTYQSCNVGLVLRHGLQSGSDIPAYNCWFRGQEGGIWIFSGFTGLTIIGGQVASDSPAENDDLGAIVIGKDYFNGSTGGVGRIEIVGTAFEQIKNTWGIRCFGKCSLSINGAAFLANNGTIPGIGVLKSTYVGDGSITFENIVVGGNFSSPKLVDFSNYYSTHSIIEKSGPVRSKGVTVGEGGLPFTAAGLLIQSRYDFFTGMTGNGIHTTTMDMRKQRLYVKNNSATAIEANRLVAFEGRNGSIITVKLASTGDEKLIIGVSETTIPANGGLGYIVVKGVASLKTTDNKSTKGNYALPSDIAGEASNSRYPPIFSGFAHIIFTDSYNGKQEHDPLVVVG